MYICICMCVCVLYIYVNMKFIYYLKKWFFFIFSKEYGYDKRFVYIFLRSFPCNEFFIVLGLFFFFFFFCLIETFLLPCFIIQYIKWFFWMIGVKHMLIRCLWVFFHALSSCILMLLQFCLEIKKDHLLYLLSALQLFSKFIVSIIF